MRWFKAMIDEVEGYMRVSDTGVDYFSLKGEPITFVSGSVYITENDVTGPF